MESSQSAPADDRPFIISAHKHLLMNRMPGERADGFVVVAELSDLILLSNIVQDNELILRSTDKLIPTFVEFQFLDRSFVGMTGSKGQLGGNKRRGQERKREGARRLSVDQALLAGIMNQDRAFLAARDDHGMERMPFNTFDLGAIVFEGCNRRSCLESSCKNV